jgi:Putative transposase
VWSAPSTRQAAPLSLKKLVYLDGHKAVLYRSRMNPSLGRNFEALDPLEWLARMSDHIPDPGRHRTHFYGFYASRFRAATRETDASGLPAQLAPAKRRCSPSWERLISKVYQADPLVRRACGGPLTIFAYITDESSITRILDHLGLSPPPQQQPQPTRERVLVPVDEEAREILPG